MPGVRCPICQTVYYDVAGQGRCPYCGTPAPRAEEPPTFQPDGQPPAFQPDILPIDPRGVPRRRRWFGFVSPTSGRGTGAIALIVVFALLVFADPLYRLAAAPFTGLNDPGTQSLPDGYFTFAFVVSTVFFVLLPLLYLLIIYPDSFGLIVKELRLRVRPITLVWMMVGAASTVGVMILFGGVLQALIHFGVVEEPDTSSLVLALKPELTWFLVFAIPTVAAVTEEIFFRGFLQPRAGLIASSLLFGVVHIGYGTWIQIIVPVVLGFFFGFLYLKTKTLWAPIVGHFTFDFVQLVALYLTD